MATDHAYKYAARQCHVMDTRVRGNAARMRQCRANVAMPRECGNAARNVFAAMPRAI